MDNNFGFGPEEDDISTFMDNSKILIISDFEGFYNPVISRRRKIIIPAIKVFSNLNGDFATFKNSIKKRCSKDWIFFLDADEEISQDQIHLIREIIELNQDKHFIFFLYVYDDFLYILTH